MKTSEADMVWLNQMIFWIPQVLAIIVLLWLWRRSLLEDKTSLRFFRNAVFLVVGIYVLQLLGRVLIFYFELRKSLLGIYLLPGEGTAFFRNNVWVSFLEPFILALVIGLFLAITVVLIRRFWKRPLFEEIDPLIIFLTAFVVGMQNIFVLLLGSLLLMLIFKIFSGLIWGKEEFAKRLKIAPFLLLTAIIILVLINFNFYYIFLSQMGLAKFY